MSASVGGWSWTNQEKRTPMTEMKHTKEPWKYNDKTGRIEGLTREPDKHWTGKCHVIGHLFHDADSARAAVCVSALSGIHNPPAFVEAAIRLAAGVKKVLHFDETELVGGDADPVGRRSALADVTEALRDIEKHLPAEEPKNPRPV